MIVDSVAHALSIHVKERGYQARVVSITHLPHLENELDSFRQNDWLDREFDQRRLAEFSFHVPDALPNAQSVIVVAVPRPQTRAIFTWNGQRYPLVLPPTYTAYDAVEEHAQTMLATILRENGYALTRTELPLKLLAVRSGLGQYGRNNICYVPGMGSFLQLVAVYSDMPCEDDGWQEKTMMDSCDECDLCHRACPTGAISPDRFLLRAERCISYHNEKGGDVPFPAWMEASWHNCIVGCMRCQRVCPKNREFLQWIGEEEEFSEEETTLLLQGGSQDKLPAATLRKLEHLSLVDYLNCLPRNLGVFLNKAE